MTITTKHGNVFDSGTIIINDEGDIRFDFASDFIVIIRFASDNTNKQRREGKVENNTLVLSLFNYHNTLGTSNPDPLSIGNLNGKDILLNFETFIVGSKEKHSTIFHYTWFEKEAK